MVGEKVKRLKYSTVPLVILLFFYSVPSCPLFLLFTAGGPFMKEEITFLPPHERLRPTAPRVDMRRS
jgi:hypothetical protein